MNDLTNIIGNVGFPIAVTAFLLVRLEKQMAELNSTLVKLMEIICENQNKEVPKNS